MNNKKISEYNGFKELYVVDEKYGDVSKDGEIDKVYLLSRKSGGFNSIFEEDIKIVIDDRKTGKETIIPLENVNGYNFNIFLGEFTNEHTQDILIRGLKLGEQRCSYAYIYTYENEKYNEVFNTDTFYKEYTCEVKYKNNYIVEVTCKITNSTYVIDISHNPKMYLDLVYDENGNVKGNPKAEVTYPKAIYPVNDGEEEINKLMIIQRIIGQTNSDTLGFIETELMWDGEKFMPDIQLAAIFADKIGYKI
ncbi:hypothetical protein [Clostridium sp.]|uniref:hypothetical protein n=1 Tax=Clostridium sp. TaxID=1506 RepID=UPI003F2B0BBC